MPEFIKVPQLIQVRDAHEVANAECLGCAHHTPDYEQSSAACRKLCAQHDYSNGVTKHPCYQHIWIENTPEAKAEYTALRLAGEAAVIEAYEHFFTAEE